MQRYDDDSFLGAGDLELRLHIRPAPRCGRPGRTWSAKDFTNRLAASDRTAVRLVGQYLLLRYVFMTSS